MFATHTSNLRRLAGLFALVVAAFALVAAQPSRAQAAGESGPYKGADVYCKSAMFNFGRSKLEIGANISRHLRFSWQWVAYSHRLRNIDTGAITQLGISSTSNAYMFLDNRAYVDPGDPYTGGWLTWNAIASGNYRVETKYYWHSGYWVETPWIAAIYYGNSGAGNSYCIL